MVCSPSKSPTIMQHQCNWSAEQHRRFVSIIFSIGILHASPTSVLDMLSANRKNDSRKQAQALCLTVPRVKSHLQKFRCGQEKAHSQFLKEYDLALSRLLKKSYRKLGSDVKKCLHESEPGLSTQSLSTECYSTFIETTRASVVMIPRLTLEEINSPNGAILGLAKGLLLSLKAELRRERNIEARSVRQRRTNPTENDVGLQLRIQKPNAPLYVEKCPKFEQVSAPSVYFEEACRSQTSVADLNENTNLAISDILDQTSSLPGFSCTRIQEGDTSNEGDSENFAVDASLESEGSFRPPRSSIEVCPGEWVPDYQEKDLIEGIKLLSAESLFDQKLPSDSESDDGGFKYFLASI